METKLVVQKNGICEADFLSSVDSALQASKRSKNPHIVPDKHPHLPAIGVPVPVLRKIASATFSGTGPNAEKNARYLWVNATCYEMKSIPLYYYQQQRKSLRVSAFDVMQVWVNDIGGWEHCDLISSIISYLNETNKDVVYPYLEFLNRSNDRWKVRVSLVSLIHYSGKNAVYLAPRDTFPLVRPHLLSKDKYIANAVGWVLRETAKVHRESVEEFVRPHWGAMSALARQKSALKLGAANA